MGYTTDFTGVLKFKKELTSSQLAYLNNFLDIDLRDTKWSKISSDYGYYIDLKLTKDYSGIEWNGAEKTYHMVEAVNFVTKRMREKYPDFELVGELAAQGEDALDRWTLKMVDGIAKEFKVGITSKIVICPHCEGKVILDEAEEYNEDYNGDNLGEDENGHDLDEDDEEEYDEDEDYDFDEEDEDEMIEEELDGCPEVKIVNEKGKLRAIASDGGFVRFPRDKRIEGAVYKVNELKPGKSGSWIACGDIWRIK